MGIAAKTFVTRLKMSCAAKPTALLARWAPLWLQGEAFRPGGGRCRTRRCDTV